MLSRTADAAPGIPGTGLSSPLLAYRAPEGTEDDLIIRGTDLNTQFYMYLAAQGNDRQTIIVENYDPPAPIKTLPYVTMFTGNPHSGRCGLFPITSQRSPKTE